MDYTSPQSGEQSDNPFPLIYPLAVEFEKHAPQVRLQTLSFAVLSPAHWQQPPRKWRENDVFLEKRTLQIPWKYHLYLLINVREESYNVNFVTVLLRQAFDVHRSARRYRDKQSWLAGAYKNYQPASKNDGKREAKKSKQSKLHGIDSMTWHTLSGYPESPFTQGQKNSPGEATLSIKLTLALRDINASITSLYDFLSLFGERFDYERSQHSGVAMDDNLPDEASGAAHHPTLNAANIQFKRTNNLYVCSFDNRSDFQTALDYLTSNSANWAEIYAVPVGLEDDCIRFSLDMFIHHGQLEREIEWRRRRYALISGTGLRSNSLISLSHLNMAEHSLLNDEMDADIDDQLAPEALLEQTNRGSALKTEKTATESKNAPPSPKQKKRIDIFSCFSIANWAIYNRANRLITPVDRLAFERLLLKSHPAFFQSLAVPFSKKRFDQLYQTPLLFVPAVLWDLETIANNPCTIPRGVASDEAVVSIALVMERPAIDLLRLAMIWLLVPEGIDEEERQRITSQSVLRAEREHNLHAAPTVICYSDERAMLYDFCALMIMNIPLLYNYMGIAEAHFPAYRQLCCFLIGHNSVGYDYAFILNRCLFFGLDDVHRHLTRKMQGAGLSREINALYTFNDAQICIDTLLFLRTRMRHLSAFDLRSVLRFYRCEITKMDLDAAQIRHFYHALGGKNNNGKLSSFANPMHRIASRANSRLNYFSALMRYNIFDCLSLCDLLAKLSFVEYVTTLMRGFSVPLESALYRGNSRLLPSILINDCLREKREFLVPTHENQSIFSIDRGGAGLTDELRDWLKTRSGLPLAPLAISFEYQYPFDCTAATLPRHSLYHLYNPYIEFVEYLRTIRWINNLIEPGQAEQPPAFHQQTDWQLEAEPFYRFASLSLPCDRQLDLLRIGEKTYLGGMNYADPCHVKHPILMDYHSFYPSIIRHYELDINNVAIFTVKKLLLAIRPIGLLEEIIRCQFFRLFDYTALQDVDVYVNKSVFSSPRFHAIFTPKSYCRREWHEGIEIESLALLLASSRSLERRVLVLMKKMDDSVIDRVVTQALHRRDEWKRKKRQRPDDKIIQSRELMDKLLANGTYGYLNYSKSVVFSRPTAAAVTLLCRHTFCRTRFIIESAEWLRRVNLDPDDFCSQVVYIDTDGCIVFIEKKDDAELSAPPLFSVNEPAAGVNMGLRIALPDFNLTTSGLAIDAPTKSPLNSSQHLPLLTARKDQFIAHINELLNMQYVTLAAEHHDAIAASVFATKKYALYKVESIYPPKDSVKKTGFESNASLPIKSLYDVVLRNLSLLNHGYNIVQANRFVCKIVRHRAFFFALFDTLYIWWQAALQHRRQQSQLEYQLFDPPDQATDTLPEAGRFNITDFATRVPLNPKDTKGKLAEFIDRVLRDFKYDVGDRVRILKLAPILEENAVTIATANGDYMLYDVTDSHFELFDIAKEKMDTVLPDFKYFLGGHATYLYQCIEGCQTLRERASCQFEPVAWSSRAAFFHHLGLMHKKGYVCAMSESEIASLSAGALEKNTLYLRSFNALYDLNYALWLWQRILSKRLDPRQHDRVLIRWNSQLKIDVQKYALAGGDEKMPLSDWLQSDIVSKDIHCAPPKMLSAAFFNKWLTDDSETADRRVFEALFTEKPAVASSKDIAAKKRLIRSGALLYKRL